MGFKNGINHFYVLQLSEKEWLQSLNCSLFMNLLNGWDTSPPLQVLSYIPAISLSEVLTPVPTVGDFEADLELDGHVHQHEHSQFAFSQDPHHSGEVVQDLAGLHPAHVLPPKRLSLDQVDGHVLHLPLLSPIRGPPLKHGLALSPLRLVHLLLSQKCSFLHTVS